MKDLRTELWRIIKKYTVECGGTPKHDATIILDIERLFEANMNRIFLPPAKNTLPERR